MLAATPSDRSSVSALCPMTFVCPMVLTKQKGSEGKDTVALHLTSQQTTDNSPPPIACAYLKSRSSAMKSPPLKENRCLLVSFGILQTSCVSGIMFGWAGVAGSLLIADAQDGGAGLTLEQTTAIFAMVASTASFSPLALGIVLDKYGPRVASVLSNIIIGIGMQTIACAHSYTAFAVGACTVAFGGPGIQSSVISFANLFPENQFFVLCCVNGSISNSFAVLPIFGMLWESYGIGFRVMFQTYLVLVILSAIGSLLLLPDAPFEEMDDFDDLQLQDTDTSSPLVVSRPIRYQPSPEKLIMESTKHSHLIEQPLDSFLRQDPLHELERHESFVLSKKAFQKGELQYMSLKDMPFLRQLTSGSFIRTLVVFVATSFFANFYIASITTEVSRDSVAFCQCQFVTQTSALTFLSNIS